MITAQIRKNLLFGLPAVRSARIQFISPLARRRIT